MPRRLQPPKIKALPNGSWRVLGTVHGKQSKRIVRTRAEAEVIQAEWAGAAPLPLVQTTLPCGEIRDAEYLVTTCRDLGLTPREAAHYLVRYYKKTDAPPLSQAVEKFLDEKRAGNRDSDHVGRLKGILNRLMSFLKHDDLALLTVSEVEAFLVEFTADLEPRSYNHYRNAIHALLLWCQRRWWIDRVVTGPIVELPVERTEPDALPAAKAVQLLRFIEAEHPEWILFYTLAMVVGLRPDGEMERMQKELAAGNTVFTDVGFMVMGKGLNGQPRRRFIRWESVPVFRAWYAAYPLRIGQKKGKEALVQQVKAKLAKKVCRSITA